MFKLFIYYYHLGYFLWNVNIRILDKNNLSFSKFPIRISTWITVFNLLLEKYKENFSYACECWKNIPGREDVLFQKIKYNLLSYPVFLFLLFDFQYTELELYKSQIYKLVEEKLILNMKVEYKLIGMIEAPSINYYNTIIFNPIGQTINPNFIPANIYYHDGNKNDGKIVEIKKGEDWRIKGIPYIVLYKKLDI